MRLGGSRTYARPAPPLTMPPGLVELMEGLAKDVLKNNPENVYEFCAGHMQKLLEIRDGPLPPKKQLSLEQKIVKAQEKLRQRIKDRISTSTIINKTVSVHSSENGQHEEKQHDVESPIDNNVIAIEAVHGEELVTASEVKIFHESNVSITGNGIPSDEASQDDLEVKEHIAGKQILETEKVNEEVKEHKTTEIKSEIEAIVEIENNLNVIQDTQIKDAAEDNSENTKHVEQVLQSTENEEEIETIEKIENNANVIQDTQKKDSFDDNSENTEHVEQVPQSTETEEAQMTDTERIINKIDINVVEKTLNLYDESLQKEVSKGELNETVSALPSTNNPKSVISHINDISYINDVTEEDTIIKKKELTDTNHKDILIESNDSTSHSHENLKVKQSSDDLLPKTEITTGEKLRDNQQTPQLSETLSSGRESEQSTKTDTLDIKLNPEVPLHDAELSVKSAETDSPNVKFNFEISGNGAELSENLVSTVKSPESDIPNIKSNPEVSADGGELSEDQIINVKSSETNIPNIKSSPEVSANDAELSEDHVMIVESADKATIGNSLIIQKHLNDHDIHKTEVDNIQNVDKQIIDTDDKLPEKERAFSEEFLVSEVDGTQLDTTTIDENNTIIENDENTENTAVSAMDLETAAITIQKVFRTFLFSKSRASTLDDTVNENSLDEDIEKKDEPEYVLTSANLNKERRTLGISRMDTVLQTVNEEKSLSLSDDSSLSSAATTIQAHVRGFLIRNRLASNKTASSSSLVNSDGPSTMSLDGDVSEPKKTILNIHIVPERGQFMSRDESLLTSIDLPLDNSPPSSINLHPLGYDKSERRKLKREDAVQSISPPSNNSGKLSEEVDSVKDTLHDSADLKQESETITVNGHDKPQDVDTESCDTTLTISSTAETVVDADTYSTREVLTSPEHNLELDIKSQVVSNSSSDEMDVVTPFPTVSDNTALADTENDEKPKLVHSGEFHDLVVQTQVKRSESSVVREFKNVLVYFLLWDKS